MISGSCEDNKTVFPQRVDTFYERRVFVKLSAAGTADGNINDADIIFFVVLFENRGTNEETEKMIPTLKNILSSNREEVF